MGKKIIYIYNRGCHIDTIWQKSTPSEKHIEHCPKMQQDNPAHNEKEEKYRRDRREMAYVLKKEKV